ncbi:MAG: hypothetical protein KJZ79_08780 [Bryobacteraceae bacterium]|nr:hypothetical protein [Bryobacteraceae bacterium]
MRSVLSVCFLLLAVLSPAAAQSPERSLSVIVNAAQPLPAPVMREMRIEMDRLLLAAGIPVDFRLRSEVRLGDQLDQPVLATFKGRCALDPAPRPPVDPVDPALAFAHVTDGQIQPFAVVLCDRVAAAIRPAMWGSDFRRADLLLGRALARVLAHEIFHILGKEHNHSAEGLFKHALSGRDLIAESLDFHPRDLQRLRASSQPEAAGPDSNSRAARD